VTGKRSPGDELAAAMGEALQGFGAAVAEMMAEVGAALAPLAEGLVRVPGARAERGDPTGDPPLRIIRNSVT
jgi:hypothetical protein